jgi:hypothetical protein
MNELIVTEMSCGKYCVIPNNNDRIIDNDGKLLYGTVLYKNSNKESCDRYIRRYELNKLIAENPELEVIPMVEYEVCWCDDYPRWAGSIGKSMIREYFFDNLKEGELRYKDFFTEDGLKDLEDRGVKWNKAIFLFIDLPDEL